MTKNGPFLINQHYVIYFEGCDSELCNIITKLQEKYFYLKIDLVARCCYHGNTEQNNQLQHFLKRTVYRINLKFSPEVPRNNFRVLSENIFLVVTVAMETTNITFSWFP